MQFISTLRDAVLLRHDAFINGQWVGAQNGATFPVTDPASGEVLGSVPLMGQQETRLAIEAAEAAWPAWRAKTGHQRAAILRRWYELMLENTDDLARIISAEQGRPLA